MCPLSQIEFQQLASLCMERRLLASDDDDICLLNDRVPFNDVRTRTNDCQPDLLRNAKHTLGKVECSTERNAQASNYY